MKKKFLVSIILIITILSTMCNITFAQNEDYSNLPSSYDLRNDMNTLSAADLKNKLPEYEQRFARYEQAAQQAGAGYQAPNQDNYSSNDDNGEGPINA